jgi:sucrose-phosphate synthase
MAYLAWRVWFMKRALQKRERLREESSLEELSDDDDAVDSDDLPLSQQVSAPPPAPPVTPPRTETEAANKNVEAKESEEITKLSGSAVSDAQEEQSSNGNKDKDDLLPPPSAFGDGLRNTSPYLDADDGLFVREPPAVDYVDDLVAQSPDGLYVVLLSVHGLVRGKKMELGRDPDTGGQVKYVVELAKALSQIKPVYRVDLITRLVDDPQVCPSVMSLEPSLLL